MRQIEKPMKKTGRSNPFEGSPLSSMAHYNRDSVVSGPTRTQSLPHTVCIPKDDNPSPSLLLPLIPHRGRSQLDPRERPRLRGMLDQVIRDYEKMTSGSTLGSRSIPHDERRATRPKRCVVREPLPPGVPSAAERLQNTSSIRATCLKLHHLLNNLADGRYEETEYEDESQTGLGHKRTTTIQSSRNTASRGHDAGNLGSLWRANEDNNKEESEEEEEVSVPLFAPMSAAAEAEKQLYTLPARVTQRGAASVVLQPQNNEEEAHALRTHTPPFPHSGTQDDTATGSDDSLDYTESIRIENGSMMSTDMLTKYMQRDLLKLRASMDICTTEIKKKISGGEDGAATPRTYRMLRHCRRMWYYERHSNAVLNALIHQNLLYSELALLQMPPHRSNVPPRDRQSNPLPGTKVRQPVPGHQPAPPPGDISEVLSRGVHEVQSLRRAVRDLEYEVEHLEHIVASSSSTGFPRTTHNAGGNRFERKHGPSALQQYTTVLESVVAPSLEGSLSSSQRRVTSQELPYKKGMTERELLVLDRLCWKLEQCLMENGSAPGVDTEYLLKLAGELRQSLAALNLPFQHPRSRAAFQAKPAAG